MLYLRVNVRVAVAERASVQVLTSTPEPWRVRLQPLPAPSRGNHVAFLVSPTSLDKRNTALFLGSLIFLQNNGTNEAQIVN